VSERHDESSDIFDVDCSPQAREPPDIVPTCSCQQEPSPEGFPQRTCSDNMFHTSFARDNIFVY
ncbi:hypothetical protein BgiBS90_006476, partial [Biomphalaria glabrata]